MGESESDGVVGKERFHLRAHVWRRKQDARGAEVEAGAERRGARETERVQEVNSFTHRDTRLMEHYCRGTHGHCSNSFSN